MKKNILVFGLISGLIVTAMMVYSAAKCYANDDFEGNIFLGYATMVVAFSMIFVGIKNFRDKFQNGAITFGKAFKIGLYISLIASTIYVGVWLIDYYLFIPDFMDKYTAHVLKQIKSSGASTAEINQKTVEMAGYKEMYKNPVYVILLTYFEVLPVGLVISLLSALILKRKASSNNVV